MNSSFCLTSVCSSCLNSFRLRGGMLQPSPLKPFRPSGRFFTSTTPKLSPPPPPPPTPSSPSSSSSSSAASAASSTSLLHSSTSRAHSQQYQHQHQHQQRPIDHSARWSHGNSSILWYTLSIIVGVTGISYAAVPFYRAICQRTGYGGTPITDSTRFTKDKLLPVTHVPRLRVTFNGSVSDVLQWKFTPQQREVRVLPGETALAFYTATNKSDEDIIGVATYSVTPAQVAPYFSKIQCFCFEEQKLLAGETVDMPVFFFIDPEFARDPQMKGIETVTLSYTFFKARYDSQGNLKPVQVVR